MNAEMLDKIQELRIAHPQADVVFFVDTDEGGDYTYTRQEIKSVKFEEIANYTENTLVGEDDILAYLEERVFDENKSFSEDKIYALAKSILEDDRKSGVVKDVILVYTGV